MINYVVVKRNIHVGKTPGTKFLARLYRNADVSLDTVAQEISVATTISYPDTLAVLKALEMAVANHVLNGSAVKFGMLGAFIPQIKAKACNSEELVTADSVKRVGCRFYPGSKFMNKLKAAQVQQKDLTVKGYVSSEGN